ncbi:MAG TPA: hypothetical protein PL143_15555, partial [Rhodocyclaceae bacterium]|nr:hypothetical protein [Rhodocyclaceae bacterium]
AIALGIGVDDTIHYLHRFVAEFAEDRDYRAAARRCHASVGRAMCYTSVTITLGFSILALSTGLAMMAALIVDLTVLPALLAVFKPLGGEGGAEAHAHVHASAEA